MSKITSLTIDRKRWGTGRQGGALLDEFNNKMCCLGFFCRAAGFKPNQIRGESMPGDLLCGSQLDFRAENIKKLSPVVNHRGRNTKITGQLATVNDSHAPKFVNNPTLRETRIAELFAKLGVKVKFIN